MEQNKDRQEDTREEVDEGAFCADEPITAFDGIIGQLREIDFSAPSREVEASEEGASSFEYGEEAGRGVILRKDVGVELGGGNAATCAMVLTTADEGLVHDGRITVIGPDISQLSADEPAPFAQIVLIGGSELVGADSQGLEEIQKVRNWVQGYQARTTTNEIAARVSKDLVARGFSLADLGEALIALARSTSPKAQAVEVLFVTSSSDDVKRLRPLANEWLEQSRGLRRCAMAEIGIDIDCPSGGHCGKCKDKDTCDQVRRIQAMRRNAKQTAAA